MFTGRIEFLKEIPIRSIDRFGLIKDVEDTHSAIIPNEKYDVSIHPKIKNLYKLEWFSMNCEPNFSYTITRKHLRDLYTDGYIAVVQ